MANKKKGTSVAEVEDTALAKYVDYGEDFGEGSDVDASEVSLPFIKILDTKAKELVPENTLGDDAKPGMILNTGSQAVSKTVHFIPAVRQRKFVAWRDRKDGGGIVATYDPSDDVVVAALARSTKFGKYFTEAEGDVPAYKLAETFYIYGIIADENGLPEGMAVVAFASTQIKKWKKGMKRRMDSVMVPAGGNRKKKPPIFCHQVILGVQPETNGEDHWFGWTVKFVVDDNVKASLLTPDNPLYIAARELREAVQAGTAKIDETQADDSAPASSGASEEEEF